jgi:hypothetical protein
VAHTVKFSLPECELGRADVEFLVKKDGSVFGKLLVSKGAIVWRKKWKSKRGKKLGWTRFAQLMQEQGEDERG